MTNEVTLLNLVQHDLQRVEEKMRSIAGGGTYAPLAEAFLQLFSSGGKRLRPALAIGAYGLLAGHASDKVIAVAAAVETLHNATLVHDDLIDNALVRRGITTLNAVWSKGATVLAGDYLFARAAGFAAETENVPVIQLFADTLRIICEGELRQLFSSRQWRQAKEAYYPRIFAKTASLFAASTRSGALLAGAIIEQEQALYDYGKNLGMAFQIVDDILDYSSTEETLGKPVGGDLRQGIMTLPFFYFLQTHPNPEQIIARLEQAFSLVGTGQSANSDAISEIVAQVRASEAIRLAAAEAADFAARARSALAGFSDNAYRRALLELADFVVARHV
ncbi:MAG: polyprenyl synthetase family protein [Anaerolineae bacterium]